MSGHWTSTAGWTQARCGSSRSLEHEHGLRLPCSVEVQVSGKRGLPVGSWHVRGCMVRKILPVYHTECWSSLLVLGGSAPVRAMPPGAEHKQEWVKPPASSCFLTACWQGDRQEGRNLVGKVQAPKLQSKSPEDRFELRENDLITLFNFFELLLLLFPV